MKKLCIIGGFVLLAISAAFAEKKADEINPPHLEAGLSCESCHGSKTPEKRAPASICIECHTDKSTEEPLSFKDAAGKSFSVNPHSSHAGNMRCTLCHKIHSASMLYCNEGCHHTFDLVVP